MSTPANLPAAIYVTRTKKGGVRYSTFSRGRLWPCTREIAERAFAAGATVYAKAAGRCVFEEGACVVISEGAA